MEPIIYNKLSEIIRRTPIRIEESVDTEFIDELRKASEERIKLELIRTQLIDAGIINEYQLCDDEECDEILSSDSESSENDDDKMRVEFQREFEIDERRRCDLDENYIVISDDEDDIIFISYE